jgi:phosphatidylinositol alpha 1,6-mannosyltransferase
VRHRSTGLLFRPDDPAALADALVELVDDIPFRLALGRHALAHAQRRSWSASYDELLAGYAAVTRRVPVAHPLAA